MRPFLALLRTLAIVALTLTACSSQAIIEEVAKADEADAGSVGEVLEVDGAKPTSDPAQENPPEEDDKSRADDGGDDEELTATRSLPAGWVAVPGRDEARSVSEFDALVDALADEAALQTTFTALSESFVSLVSYSEVRESNHGESRGTYSTNGTGTRVLSDGLVWTEDRERPNLYVGVEAREKDQQLTNSYLLERLRDSIVDVVGYEQSADGSARWYLLVDPVGFVAPFEDWQATGTVFDLALTTAKIDPTGALRSIQMDLGPATYVRYTDVLSSRPPHALEFAFETFDSRLPIGPPCDAPTAGTDDRSRDVLLCPIDSEGFIAPHTSVGYLDDPSAVAAAFLIANLLSTAGYSVDLVPLTEGVDAAYADLAANTIDLYASGLFPFDQDQLARARADGGTVGEAVERFDDPLVAGTFISSLVVTAEWAEAADISSVGDINANPTLYGALDSDGNGKGEIEGCPINHPCRPWLENQVASVWSNLELTDRSYQAAYDDLFLAKVLGQPALAVVTLPDPKFNNLLGDWAVVSVPGGVPDINEEIFGETCDGGPSTCQPGSECRSVGESCLPVFAQADLEVVANSDWVVANPVGAALVEQMTIDAEWLHAVADDASQEDSDTGAFRVDTYGADYAADGWVSSREAIVERWIDAALAADPSFDVAQQEALIEADSASESGSTPIPLDQLPRRHEGDQPAWEQAVLRAVQQSGAIERGDSTELLSTGAGAVCDEGVEAEAIMQLFDAARGRFVDLDAQVDPFFDLMLACDLKPSPRYLKVSNVDAEELPAGVGDWDGFVAHVQQSGSPWGSFDDVEIMAARSCIRGTTRIADYAACRFFRSIRPDRDNR